MTIDITNLGELEGLKTITKEAFQELKHTLEKNKSYLHMRVEGQQAQAITAFVDRLNRSSQALFTSLPEQVESLHHALETFQTALNGVGFHSGHVRSTDEDVSEVIRQLTDRRDRLGVAFDRLGKADIQLNHTLEQQPAPSQLSGRYKPNDQKEMEADLDEAI